jgi:hypothetical protein
MRAVLLGLVMLAGLSVSVLAIRPGGFRRQLRLVARRFRLVLLLVGIYVVASTVIRIVTPEGWVADYGPPAIAIALGAAFMVFAQDPALPPGARP